MLTRKQGEMFQIDIDCGDRQLAVSVDPETNLLEALREASLPVRKACRNGACGICRCRLADGEITYRQREPFALWQKDIDAGFILPCIAYALGDLQLTELTLEAE